MNIQSNIQLHVPLLFKGVVDTVSDLPETADLGDAWYVSTTGNTYVYSGTDWVCVFSGTNDVQQSRDSEPTAQICTQCNGTLELDTFGRLHCPYCGTIYM